MPSPLPYFEFWQQDWLASSGTRRLSLAARGAYVDLLCFQWEDGCLDDDIEALARMVGVGLSDFKKVWPELEKHFPVTEAGCRRNSKCHELREKTIEKVAKNKANGSSGGRPPKAKAEPNAQPQVSDRKTQSKPNGLANAKPTGNPEQTQDKPKRKPLEIRDLRDSETSVSGASVPDPPVPDSTPLAVRAASEPFDSIQRVLVGVATELDVPEPTADEIRRHLRQNDPLRRLVDKLGVEQTIELYVFVTRHKQLGMDWGQIWNQHTPMLAQMKAGGIAFIPKLPEAARVEAPSNGPTKPIDGIDFVWLPDPNDRGRDAPVLKWDKETGERWDEEAWRERKKLKASFAA